MFFKKCLSRWALLALRQAKLVLHIALSWLRKTRLELHKVKVVLYSAFCSLYAVLVESLLSAYVLIKRKIRYSLYLIRSASRAVSFNIRQLFLLLRRVLLNTSAFLKKEIRYFLYSLRVSIKRFFHVLGSILKDIKLGLISVAHSLIELLLTLYSLLKNGLLFTFYRLTFSYKISIFRLRKVLLKWRIELTATQVLVVMIAAIFIALMFVYQTLVTNAPDEYVLPNLDSVIDEPSRTLEESEQNIGLFPKNDNSDVSILSDDDNADYDPLVTTNPLHSVEKVPALVSSIDYEIKRGDTLGRIFTRLGLSRASMLEVLEADQEYLVLEPLMPGDIFTFELDQNGNLAKLTRRLDISKSIYFEKHDNGGFTYHEVIKPISYIQTAVHGTIDGNFYLSAKKFGLSDNNISIIHDVLQGRVDFRKDLRKGDAFDFVLQSGNIDGVKVGEIQLEALQITVKGKHYSAFLHSDGRFYDSNANSLTPALRRWPTTKHYRISSPFNSHRLHPITGRPAPHNGVDLATPIGTKILATGDGVVTRVSRHKYAGLYIVIDYAGPYGARFLHLSKALVKKGQQVKRGQVIALAGNTGRTTGAHLHYELHIRGRPVNPMTTKIPTAQSIPEDQRDDFNLNVQRWIKMMSKDVEPVATPDNEPEVEKGWWN